MKLADRPGFVDEVLKETIPMHGRMIHGRSNGGELWSESQAYDIHGRVSTFSSPCAIS
jgi:kynurenine 3-monooxygenase